jgi:hypothetical protein
METVLVLADDYKDAAEFIERMGAIWPSRAIMRNVGSLTIENLELLAIRKKFTDVISLYKGRLHRPTMVVFVGGNTGPIRHTPFFHYIGPGDFADWMMELSKMWEEKHPPSHTDDLRRQSYRPTTQRTEKEYMKYLGSLSKPIDVTQEEFDMLVAAIDRYGLKFVQMVYDQFGMDMFTKAMFTKPQERK